MNSNTLTIAAIQQFILHEISVLRAAEGRIAAGIARARRSERKGHTAGFASAVIRLEKRAEMLDRLLDQLEPRTVAIQGELAAA